MKINEKLGLGLMDGNHFISLLFTLWASLSATTQQGGRAGGFHRSASGGLLRQRHPPEADSLSLKCTALRHEASGFLRLRSFSFYMKASDSCKIQVLYLEL